MNTPTKKESIDQGAYKEALEMLSPMQRNILGQSRIYGMSPGAMSAARQLKANYQAIKKQRNQRE